ncbi:MAG: hypothetical protein QOJ79_1780 [Actinomycetota bacterium]|jgi:hypothetical protein|nr:hypothetical protein [Actinomycetota bacterium]
MNSHLVRRSVVVSVSLLAVSMGSMATAQADPSDTGCPASYTVFAVADLALQGYRVPGQVDDPNSGIKSYGRTGNGDGLVCAHAISGQTTTWGGQLYTFWDNTQRT